MGDRAVAIVRIKASALKDNIAKMKTMLTEEIIDKPNLFLRLTDLTASFHKYEEAYETLCVIDKARTDNTEWSEIRELYYSLAVEVNKFKPVDSTLNNQTLPGGAPIGNSTFIEKQKSLKLPIAEVPKFDGNHNEWLSYKNAFISMVDSRNDIDDTVKFMYLRNSLEGEALRKISVYDIGGESYVAAWKTLVSSYEKKRLLVSKHIDAILNTPPANDMNSKGLSNLIDEIKQHLKMLKVLKVEVEGRIVVRIIERALPISVRKKWEESLDLDELPNLDKISKFANDTACRLHTLEADAAHNEKTLNSKRNVENSQNSQPYKHRKRNDGTQALITNVEALCPMCKDGHALFRCDKFKNLSTAERWSFVRAEKLCVNCLRLHKGKCTLGHCRKCEKNHNSLLHAELNSKSTDTLRNLTNLPTPTPTPDSNA